MIDVDLILAITGLPRVWSDPVTLFEKGKNPAHIEKFKEKYDLVSFGKEFLISSINDLATRMETTISTHKWLHIL